MIHLDEFKQYGKNAINQAINVCSQNGGGDILIPKGRWKSGAIHLKSNIHIHLEDGAEIEFSDKFEDYLPVVFTRWEGMECYNYSPLIYADGGENISVTGNGKLIGNGQAWWHWKKLQQEAALELCMRNFIAYLPKNAYTELKKRHFVRRLFSR